MNTNRKVTKFLNKYKQATNQFVICTARGADFFVRDGYRNFRTYIGNTVRGNSKVWTSPFAKGESTEDMLAAWQVILESGVGDMPSLLKFENDLRAKVGPLSIQKPLAERMDDITSYFTDVYLPSKPVPVEALMAVLTEYRSINGLRLRSPQHTLEAMKKSSNSGVPYFTKRRNVVPETLNHEQQRIYVAVIGWRGQEGGSSADDVKQRVIWMFPFELNMSELQVYQPLIEGCQRNGLVPPWISNDAVDERITALFDSKADGDLVVCTDFTKFDQHFNADMQDAAGFILANLLTRSDESKKWMSDVFREKYHIPLIINAAEYQRVELIKGFHGMASGSGGTNADETLAHRALQHEAAMSHGEVLNPNSMCLGDDGILTYPGISVEDVVEVYSSHGQECNVSKQYASTQDCVFLRRWHSSEYRREGRCVGVYSTYRALGRMRYLERFMNPEVWTPEMVNLRYLSILENCKWHPLFHELIEFCMKRDKFRLGIDLPGFFDDIKVLAQKATDYMPDFLGYTKTLQGETGKNIEEWEVVKYLRSRG